MENETKNVDDWLKRLPIRPNWDVYYMTMAFVVAQRSFDPSTKCGCVIVSKDNRVLSTGYNGPIKGSPDPLIPTERPLKYSFFIHSELNALLAYNGSYVDIQNSKCYITHYPCADCLRSLIQKGIKTIYYSDITPPKCIVTTDSNVQKTMIQHHCIKIIQLSVKDILNNLQTTMQYITEKIRSENKP